MRIMAVIALALAIGACSDPAEPDPEIADLVGTWMSPVTVLVHPGPSLTFTANRRFISRSTSDEVQGRYRVEGNVLIFEEGAPHGMYEGGPFSVEGNVLTLHYIGWGPADEPVERTVELHRVPALPRWY